MKSPLVTVLMPVYNGEKYLKDAMDSILNQTFADFELLVINDGSTDGSEKIIRTYSDSRIRLVNNDKNIGLVNTLNKGFELAKGDFIARMDCDDVSLRNRLTKQVKFLEKHPEVAACGTFYNLLLNGKLALVDLPADQKEMDAFMVFNCPIAHPTVMLRTSLIRQHRLTYRVEFMHAEDYDLWSRLSDFAGLANIREPLLNYRVHPGQITENKSFVDRKRESLAAIRLRHLKKMGLVPSEDELRIHHLISDGRKPESELDFQNAEIWLKKIFDTNTKTKMLHQGWLGKIIIERWLRLCFNYYGGTKGFSYFIKSELYKSIQLPAKLKLELLKNLYNSFKRKAIK